MADENSSRTRSADDMILLARLLQFSDSTLPVGAFAFSNGLESAIQTGVVADAESLERFVETVVRQASGMDGIAFLHAHRAARRGAYDAVLEADRELWNRRVGEEQQMMLARMGRILLDFDISVQNAKIVTLGERVDDVFVLTDADNQALSDPALCESLQQTIIDTLSSTQPTEQAYSSPIAIGP